MNFRDLEYVIETAKNLSFSKAADICNVSQPSLSTQIKKLEEELGAEIFIRNKRKITLSGFGAVFVQKAKRILAIREEIKFDAAKTQNPLEGHLNLGGILTVAPYVFPHLIHRLAQKAPDLKLSLKEAKTEDLLKDLLDGRIDVAMISLPTDDNVFESRFLFNDPFYVAVADHHELAAQGSISEDDLRGQDLILLDEGHCFRTQALDVCHSTSARENDIFQASSLETIRHFVAIGEAITLMPSIARQENDGITYIPMDQQKFSREIGIVWRKSSHKSLQIEQLVALIRDFGFMALQ